MQSAELLDDLEQISLQHDHDTYSLEELAQWAQDMDAGSFSLELAMGLESAIGTIIDGQEVPPDLQEAYEASSPNVADSYPLQERYNMVLESGEGSIGSFIKNLKSKLFEIRCREGLQEMDPSREWELAARQNQPIWDIQGTLRENGEVDSVQYQIKSHQPENAEAVVGDMAGDPETPFILPEDTIKQIQANHGDAFNDQIVDLELSSAELPDEVENALEVLAESHNIPIPDAISDVAPYLTEIVLGIQFLRDVTKTEKDMSDFDFNDRKRMHGLRTLMLMSRFGVSAVCITVGTSAGGGMGSVIPGVGNLVGGILGGLGGAGGAYYLKKKVMPRATEIGLKIVSLEQEDLVYLKYRDLFDHIGASLAQTSAKLARS